MTHEEAAVIVDSWASIWISEVVDEGFRAIGVEQDADYIQLIHARLETEEDGGLF